MLRHLNPLKAHTVIGVDGEIGPVHGFHFDDAHWKLRYVVADSDGTLPQSKVLVSLHALEEPDWDRGHLPINLTRGHFENSPEIAVHPAVHPEHEVAYAQHFGWPEWRTEVAQSGDGAGEPGLRNANMEYGVDALNRYLGRVTDFLVDCRSWEIRYLVVDMVEWDVHRKLLVPPSWIHYVSWQNHILSVDLRFEDIARAPRWHGETPPDRAFEEQLHRHYGRRGYWES